MDWRAFQDTKRYDLLMALPLVLWFGGAAWHLRPSLVGLGGMIARGTGSAHVWLLFIALFLATLFNLLVVWLLLVRDKPVRRARGMMPYICGFAGTFLGVAILYLPRADLSLHGLLASDGLLILGFSAATLILARLGKSFSIMPEARTLVTTGPYAYARHPLYAAEALCVAGNAILFQQPWAGLLAVGVVALQVIRSLFEERVLEEAYPDYAAYRRRTKRFVPGVL